MDESLVPIIVSIIGIFQVVLAIYFARGKNRAIAERDAASAAEAIGSTYSMLIERLEERLEKVEAKYEKLCEEYEKDKLAWRVERSILKTEIARLESLIDSK